MESSFRALVVESNTEAAADAVSTSSLRTLGDDYLGEGDVTVDVEYSSVNYKDALALTGRPGVIRTTPLIAGIDLVGTVSTSESDRFAAGDRVVLNGAWIGERFNGGLSERARVSSASLVLIPPSLSSFHAAAIGTAGFTAMLSVLALERHGVRPDSGEVLVTGAAGGVGSIATALLAGLGYEVTASTGRAETQGGFLRSLGAAHLLDRAELSREGRPLQNARWVGTVDTAGGRTLANVLARTAWGGTVAACGLADSADLPTTVMPFILRAVNLIGINSVEAPLEERELAWERLSSDLDPAMLDSLTEQCSLAGVLDVAPRVLAGEVRGRTVVDVRA